MSALFRTGLGAVAVGLCCLTLSATAQQTNRDLQGGVRPAAPQPDAANPQNPNDRAGTQQADRNRFQRGLQGQPYSANFRGDQRTGHSSAVENYFVNCLLKHNKAEIEMAKFASEQSQNPQVKQFADQLVRDHQAVIDKLQQIAGTGTTVGRTNSDELGSTPRTDADRNAADPNRLPGAAIDATPGLNDRTTTGETAANRPGAAQGSTALNQVASIEEKIMDRCQQALREELQQKSGAEFDECFIGAQIGGHMHALAALEVLSQESQGQLKQIADEARPTIQKHLDHAKSLAKQLKSGSQSAQAQRTSTSAETPR
jgi:predicted outer membrane protein